MHRLTDNISDKSTYAYKRLSTFQPKCIIPLKISNYGGLA